jgi:carbon monoxide dehydrogenase subunit G
MQMNGTRQLSATPGQAWQALNDPEILEACILGCDKFEAVTDSQYAMGASILTGPISTKFAGAVTLDEVLLSSSYVIHFEVQGGVAGFGKGRSKVQLVPNDQGVELQYQVGSRVGGKLAKVDQVSCCRCCSRLGHCLCSSLVSSSRVHSTQGFF